MCTITIWWTQRWQLSFGISLLDPQELFVPSSDYYEVIQLRTNWPTVLPCQVTSPLAKVNLHREFPPMEVNVDGQEISFDVKKGFTIHRPKQYHAGSLYCVASLGNLRQSSTKYMLIYVNCEIFFLMQYIACEYINQIAEMISECLYIPLQIQPPLRLLRSRPPLTLWQWDRISRWHALWWESRTWWWT